MTATTETTPRMPHRLYSSREVATQLGCDKSTITRTATRLEIGQKVGNAMTFTKADIEALRKAINPGPGNPNFGKPTEG